MRPDAHEYSFSLGTTLKLGKAATFEVRDWTMRSFQPKKLMMNAATWGFVTIDMLLVDSVDILVDERGEDRFPCRDALAFSHIDEELRVCGVDIISPPCRHGVYLRGRYTGLIPDPRARTYRFCVTLRGIDLEPREEPVR